MFGFLQGLYFTPVNCEDPHAELAASFRMLAAACLEDAAPARVQVAMGRHLDVPHASALPLLLLDYDHISRALRLSQRPVADCYVTCEMPWVSILFKGLLRQ